MGTHKIYSGIQGKEITYQGVYMETAMNYLPQKGTKKFQGVLPEKLGGVCSTLPETLTLFPCPISDLFKNLIPYFRPEALEPGA